MSKPFYTRAAKQDLTDIFVYIAQDKPDAALAWLEKIETKCVLIAATPEIGESKPQLGVSVRASVVGRYIIFHRLVSDRVEFLRVIPGDRNITEL